MYGATVILSNDILVELIIDDLVEPFIKHAMLYMVGEAFKDSDKVDETSKQQLAKLANEEAPDWAEITIQKHKAVWNDLSTQYKQEMLEKDGKPNKETSSNEFLASKLRKSLRNSKMAQTGFLGAMAVEAQKNAFNETFRKKQNDEIKNKCTENICPWANELQLACDEAWDLPFGNKDEYCNDWNEAMNQCAKTDNEKLVLEYKSWKLRKLNLVKPKSDDLQPQSVEVQKIIEVQIKEEKKKIIQEAQKKVFDEKLSEAYGCITKNIAYKCKSDGVKWTKMMGVATENGCGAFGLSPCDCKFNRLKILQISRSIVTY